MSQITVLGFTPSHLPAHSADALHWSILLTPDSDTHCERGPSPTRPKAKSFFSQRRLSKTDSNGSNPPQTVLFDMHSHQLRKQVYPVPILASDSSSSSASDDSSSENLTRRTTTSITSDIPNKPYNLSLQILLATHALPVSKLSAKLSTLLYRTPTYGSEEDWLRAALDMLVGSGILEPTAAFDADAILAFAGESVKEYLSQIQQGHPLKREVLELDYASHVRSMERVKAMFARPAPERNQTKPAAFTHESLYTASKPKPNSTEMVAKCHKFLGFRISTGPPAYVLRQRWADGGSVGGEGMKRAYFERRDDPYAGLM